jgi:hypothetical protein
MRSQAIPIARRTQRGLVAMGSLIFLTMELLIVAQAVTAYFNHFLTAEQIITHHSPFGLPFLWHFGMWGDFFVVSPLTATIVVRFSNQWRRADVAFSFVAGLILSSVMVYSYSLSDIAQAHVQEHHTTAAGWLHLLYMGVAISIVLLFYFRTTASCSIILFVTCALSIHLFLGTNMFLGVLKLAGGASWYPAQPLESLPGWITVASASVALWWRACLIIARQQVGRTPT